jgi:transposase
MMYASHSLLELITFLLPGAPDLRCDALDLDLIASTMTLAVTSTQAHSACPRCQQSATRIHSHYQRTVADLPWAASTVRLHLRVRRFFCSSNDCSQRIFTERVPTVVMPWARRTQRLADRQRAVGLALGGAAGARLTAHLNQPTSRDTVLRLVRQLPEPDEVTPRHLGVDDFALRKAQSYGTILVNLDTGSAIDLLLNRSAAVLATWLRAHPGVELITRDRAGAYAEGARQGAPDAVQIADRWHVLSNLADALKQIFADYPQALTPAPAKPQEQAKAGAEVVDSPDAPKVAPSQAALPPATLPLPCTRTEQVRQQRQARREVRYEQVQALVAQGVSLRTIATQLHLSRGTVRKYARSAAAPVAQPRAKRSSLLDPYKPYLVERWNAGCHVGAELVRQIQAHGYQGGRSIAMDFVAAIRKQHGVAPMKRTGLPPQTAIDPSLRAPTPRELTWVVLKRPAQRDAEEQAQLLHVQQAEPKLAVAITLAQEFAVMVRERDHARLDSWLKQAESSGLRALKSFAGGIRRDYAAVRAGLRVVYSNGVVEGNVNRLKYLKRQMYGRANFDLLRKRVLYAA